MSKFDTGKFIKNILDSKKTPACNSDVKQCVCTSRLLGQGKTLVLHGGGNTSVKATEKNDFGENEEIFFVKGSEWDLEKIEEGGFSPVRLPKEICPSWLSPTRRGLAVVTIPKRNF